VLGVFCLLLTVSVFSCLRFCCSVESQNVESGDVAAVSNVLSQPKQQAPPIDNDSEVLLPFPSPRQQAPPTDDDSDVLFPSPPPEMSYPVADTFQWPCVTNTESLSCSSVKPSIATVQSVAIPGAGTVTETNIDSATLINDVEKNSSSLLALITGVKLRKTVVSSDRSAPRLN